MSLLVVDGFFPFWRWVFFKVFIDVAIDKFLIV